MQRKGRGVRECHAVEYRAGVRHQRVDRSICLFGVRALSFWVGCLRTADEWGAPPVAQTRSGARSDARECRGVTLSTGDSHVLRVHCRTVQRVDAVWVRAVRGLFCAWSHSPAVVFSCGSAAGSGSVSAALS